MKVAKLGIMISGETPVKEEEEKLLIVLDLRMLFEAKTNRRTA